MTARDAPSPPAETTAALPEPLRALAERGTLRRYRRATVLIEEGEQGDSLYIVLAGRVRAYSCDARGREITFGLYGPGEYLGEMSLDGGPRSASVVTLEPTVCSVVTRISLERHIAEHPAFAFELLAKVIHRARQATDSTRSLALIDVYGRVTKLLEALADGPRPDASRRVAERLTQQEIASRIGASREMVSRILKDLTVGGYVEWRGEELWLVRALPARW